MEKFILPSYNILSDTEAGRAKGVTLFGEAQQFLFQTNLYMKKYPYFQRRRLLEDGSVLTVQKVNRRDYRVYIEPFIPIEEEEDIPRVLEFHAYLDTTGWNIPGDDKQPFQAGFNSPDHVYQKSPTIPTEDYIVGNIDWKTEYTWDGPICRSLGPTHFRSTDVFITREFIRENIGNFNYYFPRRYGKDVYFKGKSILNTSDITVDQSKVITGYCNINNPGFELICITDYEDTDEIYVRSSAGSFLIGTLDYIAQSGITVSGTAIVAGRHCPVFFNSTGSKFTTVITIYNNANSFIQGVSVLIDGTISFDGGGIPNGASISATAIEQDVTELETSTTSTATGSTTVPSGVTGTTRTISNSYKTSYIASDYTDNDVMNVLTLDREYLYEGKGVSSVFEDNDDWFLNSRFFTETNTDSFNIKSSLGGIDITLSQQLIREISITGGTGVGNGGALFQKFGGSTESQTETTTGPVVLYANLNKDRYIYEDIDATITRDVLTEVGPGVQGQGGDKTISRSSNHGGTTKFNSVDITSIVKTPNIITNTPVVVTNTSVPSAGVSVAESVTIGPTTTPILNNVEMVATPFNSGALPVCFGAFSQDGGGMFHYHGYENPTGRSGFTVFGAIGIPRRLFLNLEFGDDVVGEFFTEDDNKTFVNPISQAYNTIGETVPNDPAIFYIASTNHNLPIDFRDPLIGPVVN